MTDVLSGTWYLSDFDGDNIPHTFAPATGSEDEHFTIINNGDGSYTFDFMFNDGLDHVWKGSWKGVPQMVDPNASVDTPFDDVITVTATAGAVIIAGAENQAYTVCDLSGRIVARGTASSHTTVGLPAGIYFVTVGSRTFKVLVA